VDFTVYLPDEIGQRAKELPRGTLSQLFRQAVIDELKRRNAVSETLNKGETYEVPLMDDEGNHYEGRITGKEIAYEPLRDISVYLTDDKRVIVHDGDNLQYRIIDDPVDQLRGWLPPALYADALYALGEKPVVHL
jgi:hypothetical protein